MLFSLAFYNPASRNSPSLPPKELKMLLICNPASLPGPRHVCVSSHHLLGVFQVTVLPTRSAIVFAAVPVTELFLSADSTYRSVSWKDTKKFLWLISFCQEHCPDLDQLLTASHRQTPAETRL